ncbi:hypothetical protein RUM44_002796 [Polyplax serrata]|uniref:SH3 domain-binding protein 5-like protein n=1 Tax=Polyplax serrata TaxID=468196 RepID=A0ABR1AFQ9_POLSC
MFSHNCEENEDTDLDPRIQIELERLNSATDKINTLEVELDEANTKFRMLLNDSIKRLKTLSKKLGSCIERARPYYEALEISKKAQMECQRAAVQYQRANEIHQAAKETVALAEQQFLSKQHEWQFDNAWQEMLNHATIKVMEAETQKSESEMEHQKRAVFFNRAEQTLQNLQSKLRRSINKSRPYFEEKELCQRHLASQKEQVECLQKQVVAVKSLYAAALRKLEKISEEIHAKRGTVRGIREPGVGAENEIIAVMDIENFNARYKTTEPNILNSKYAKIISPTVELFEKNNINRYFPPLEMKICQPGLEYEFELDRCDLQSLGSTSATTSSAVSDEDLLEEETRLEELKQIAAKINPEADSESKVLSLVKHAFATKYDKPENDFDGCTSLGIKDKKMGSESSFTSKLEKQIVGVGETINRLSTILTSLRPKDSDDCSIERKE